MDAYAQGRLRVMVVAASVSFAPLMLVLVAQFIDTGSSGGEGGPGLILPVFAAIAGMCALTAPLLLQRMLPGPPADAGDVSPAAVVTRITTAVILAFSVAEVASLLGFVLYVLGAGLLPFLGCVVLSFAAYAACFPTPARYAAWVERAAGPSLSAGRPPTA